MQRLFPKMLVFLFVVLVVINCMTDVLLVDHGTNICYIYGDLGSY